MTPTLFGPSGSASAISSVSSRRNSLTGSFSEDMGLASHAPSLDGREEQSASMADSGSAPQLIMPSIRMPSRRPFTDEGKSMGRLKVLIAGDSGVGKTSLVKAIVQSCEHIVHVDPITPPLASSMALGRHHRARSSSSRRLSSVRGGESSAAAVAAASSTAQIAEIYASTKPYPEWWSEIDDYRVLRRRKSLGDAVLDRNICFVDTPGYGSGSSSLDTITPVTQYIEAHLRRMSSNSLSDGDMLNLLGGEGGIQVDVVFYMVSNRLRPVDIQYLRQLAPLTNIILLLAQTDLMSPSQVAASKEQIHSQLREAGVRPFSFAMAAPASPSLASQDSARQGLYAISSAAGSDHDIMDASLLMSPDYVQPLISTELTALVEQVFSQNGASWLRHSAARKYVQWRKAENQPVSRPMSLYQPLGSTSAAAAASFGLASGRSSPPYSLHGPGSPSGSQVLTPPMGATSSYALARITDHTQREERLAQVRFANWATDLQKSLASERAQYAALARGERAIWLTEKINECIQDGSLVATGSGAGAQDGEKSISRIRDEIERRVMADRRRSGNFDAGLHSSTSPQIGRGNHTHNQDPLGLLEVAADLRYKGLIALELLGSLGVLGGLAIWVTKHYIHLQAYGWLVGEWEKLWSGGR